MKRRKEREKWQYSEEEKRMVCGEEGRRIRMRRKR